MGPCFFFSFHVFLFALFFWLRWYTLSLMTCPIFLFFWLRWLFFSRSTAEDLPLFLSVFTFLPFWLRILLADLMLSLFNELFFSVANTLLFFIPNSFVLLCLIILHFYVAIACLIQILHNHVSAAISLTSCYHCCLHQLLLFLVCCDRIAVERFIKISLPCTARLQVANRKTRSITTYLRSCCPGNAICPASSTPPFIHLLDRGGSLLDSKVSEMCTS
jgi:hypothetical protein